MPAIKEVLRWEFAQSISRLAARLKDREFVGGDTFSIADIVTAHCLRWATNAKFAIEDDSVAAYRDRMTARPAFLRALDR